MIARRWEDVKAEAHRLHPRMEDPEVKAAAKARLDAYIAGYHLAELRKSVGKTQKEVAAALGVSQARVSQIEHGRVEVMGVETLRAYAAALGGELDITVRVGPHSVKVA
ncbi:helix-turn-helix domain-containing protein [Uniformispora flossi]|uniref:helix-turn-helix domain-containing protein n=1 Tax=Uniformispora flossi TaxID=3390723 RepID=UPI003C2C4DEF